MALEIINLCKSYGRKSVLNDLNITFENGIYGLLGPNGAGKSTLINIIVTALNADSGIILWNEKDNRKEDSGFLDTLGYVPQTNAFYRNYTAKQFLRYIAALKGVPCSTGRIEELLKLVNLSDMTNCKIKTFSGGMKQRLGIAQALINNPKVLILDEPTAGLDPQERIRLRNLISKISTDRIVIISTHIVPDIEYIANRVILLKNKTAFKNASPSDLIKEIEGKIWTLSVTEDELEDYIGKYKIANILREGEKYILRLVSETSPDARANIVTPGLEDVYLYWFGEVTV